MKQLIIATLIGIAMPLAAEAASQTEPNLAMGDSLTSSYWRNDRTGDWEIAFFDDCAIYRSKYWTYKQRDVNPKTGEASLLLSDGTDDLAVSVGRYRKGTRTMRIGRQKVTCSRLTDRYLPDYPTKDTRTDFVNNGYRRDTITVTGWIKDIPQEYDKEKTVTFTSTSIFLGIPQTTKAELDEQGRFTAKLPVVNSTEFLCTWADKTMNTMLEPGNSYFLLYSPQNGSCYFMGDDVRLQNELLRYPFKNVYRRMPWKDDLLEFIDIVDKRLKAQTDSIDSLCRAKPTLSTRFETYSKGNIFWGQAYSMADANSHHRFHNYGAANPTLKARKYIHETFLPKLPEQLTLHSNIFEFCHECITDVRTDMKKTPFTFNIQDHLAECAANDEELALLKHWAEYTDKKTSTASKPSKEEQEMLDKVQQILDGDRVGQIKQAETFWLKLQDNIRLLETLPVSPLIKELDLCELAYSEQGNTYAPLSPKVMEKLKAMSVTGIGFDPVEKANNYFMTLAKQTSDESSLKPSEPLQGITDGQTLMQKILEPFKGKIVLLDVWGTWCGPCKGALSKSAEEYARLKKYDIVYLYLANNSPTAAWKNIIKEYNVTGENMAHYNLPPEQQQAIEQYLKVHSFPTYKLFDRNGNLLDINVDARDLDRLENIIMQLSGQ